jgi:hypothetical protein
MYFPTAAVGHIYRKSFFHYSVECLDDVIASITNNLLFILRTPHPRIRTIFSDITRCHPAIQVNAFDECSVVF